MRGTPEHEPHGSLEDSIREDLARWNIQEDDPAVPPDFVARVAETIKARRPDSPRTEREQRLAWMGRLHLEGYILLRDETWEREAEDDDERIA